MPTAAGAPPGSGANFKALTASLAARGAHDPGALAAYIGRRKYGKKGMAALAKRGGKSQDHSGIAWEGQVIRLADDGDNDVDDMPDMGKLQCPNCGYRSDNADFQVSGGTSDTDDPAAPSALQTPARGGYASRTGAAGSVPTVRAQGAGLANRGQRAIMLSSNGRPRVPVRDQNDLLVSRGQGGTAVIRHRVGAEYIGEVGRGDDGAYLSLIDGTQLSPHNHQGAALQELIGAWNRTALDPTRPAAPLKAQAPRPDPLARLAASGIQAFATADDGDDDSGGGGTDSSGLSPRGQSIFKKLKAMGMSDAQAMAMAKRAQLAKPGQFGKAGGS
jgi:hypothetical protein